MAKMVNAIAKQMITTELLGTKVIKGDANSEIKTYFISGEELEKYRALPAPTQDKKGYQTLATQHATGETLSKFRGNTERRTITKR